MEQGPAAGQRSRSRSRQRRGRGREGRCEVAVLGGGPVGLSFACFLAEQAELSGVGPDKLHITVYDLRWTLGVDGLAWKNMSEVGTRTVQNRRREQVVTLQHSTLQLFDSATAQTREAFYDSRVWRDSENIALRDLEDRLLARVQQSDMQRYVEVKMVPENVCEAMKGPMKGPRSKANSDVWKPWIQELNFDFLVGADGAKSRVRECFKKTFKPTRLSEEPDYGIGVGFEDLDGWAPQAEALSVCVTLSQTRYLFNATGGRRGYLSIRLTKREFDELQLSAGAMCKFAHPCELWDIFKIPKAGGVPIFESKPELRQVIADGLRLFDIPTNLPTTIVAFQLSPEYVETFHVTDDRHRHVLLVGDAAMSHHFWPGRGLNTGLRSAVALAWALRGTLIDGGEGAEAQQLKNFQNYMARLRKNEVDGRSGVMFGPDSPKLPEHIDTESKPDVIRRAETDQEQLKEDLVKRIKSWRNNQQAVRQSALLRTGEAAAGWPHMTPEGVGKLSDEAIERRFLGVHSPSPYALLVMKDSGWRNPNGLTGWKLPEGDARYELLPTELWEELPKNLPPNKREEVQARLNMARSARQASTTRIHKQLQVKHRIGTISMNTHVEAERLSSEANDACKDPQDFYNIVVSIPSFDSLQKRGWEIAAKAASERPGKVSAVRVAILGNFKRGKTWFLSKLCNVPLNSNEMVHTPGLCSKHLDIHGKDCFLLDMKGENSPLGSMDMAAFQDRKAEESLIRELACELSDAFIYMVNQVGCAEQLTLKQLVTELGERSQRVSSVMVVHNLRHLVTQEDLEAAWDELKQLYGHEEVGGARAAQSTPEKEYKDSDGTVVRYLQGERDGTSMCWPVTSHFLLGRAGTEAGKLNDAVIRLIRGTIGGPGTLPVQHERSFLPELKRAIEQKIGNYFNCEAGPSSKGASEALGELRAEEAKAEDGTRVLRLRGAEGLSLRAMDVGAFVHRQGEAESAEYLVKDTGDRKLRLEVVLPGYVPEKHKHVFAVEPGHPGPKVTVSPGKVTLASADGERVLQSSRSSILKDKKFSIVLPRRVRGKDGSLRPERVKTENGITTLEWTLCDEEQVFLDVDDLQD